MPDVQIPLPCSLVFGCWRYALILILSVLARTARAQPQFEDASDWFSFENHSVSQGGDGLVGVAFFDLENDGDLDVFIALSGLRMRMERR